MIQPEATNGAVAKSKFSAPSNAAIATSRPVLSRPSHSSTTRLLKSFKIKVRCALQGQVLNKLYVVEKSMEQLPVRILRY
jgi:hypothetical protein